MRTGICGWSRFLSYGMICLALGLVSCGNEDKVLSTQATIDSYPVQGAKVYVNGNPRGITPIVLKNLRPEASLLIKLEKEGYKSVAENVIITSDDDEVFKIEIIQRVGYLTLDTDPSFASIFLDGKVYLGDTPLQARKIPIGDHVFRIEKQDYDQLEFEMKIEEDYRYSKEYVLMPSLATLSVLSTPTNAGIWINEERQAENTPALFELPPATYTISVHSPGYVMEEEALTLKPADDQRVELKMKIGNVPQGMVLIPTGEFIRGIDGGSPDERPRQKIHLDAFYIDKFEVTNKEFHDVFPSFKYQKDQDRYPVTGISYEQATAYARAVVKRLPTEEEWEKAARGTDGRKFPWGSIFDPSLCNAKTGRIVRAKAIGSYRRGGSPFGCLDMAGNAYEWTSSWYNAYPGNKAITKKYGQIFKVLRGGSYNTAHFDVRCACRHFDKMESTREDYGFRCAKDVTPVSKASN